MFSVRRRRLRLHVVPLDARPQDAQLQAHRLHRLQGRRSIEPRGLEGRPRARVRPDLE
jgi:hypothetical protein